MLQKLYMSQVIIVSNRLPVSVKKEDGELQFFPSVGGLATGLSSYANNRNNVWIGWPGIASDELTEADKDEIVTELAKHNCSPVFLTKKQIDDFYNGYSNAVLWPLFHNLPFGKESEHEHKRWWQAYRSVNREFSEAVLNTAQTDSRIWVHDYQLLLLPAMLRTELTAANIGFFLHIPFPKFKQLSKLPEHKKLMYGILGADLSGFHTPGYVDAFMECAQAIGMSIIGPRQLVVRNRAVRVGDFPMGIDYKKYANAGKTAAVKASVAAYRKKYRGLKVIAAVDRMDPSKGLVERLKAYREFLKQTPELHGKVVFSMIAAPSRTEIEAYKRLSGELDKLVEEINSKYGTAKWQPVDYMNVSKPFEEVTALFQVADVAFIAPLRDGMNLAAKEFVASKQKDGVLILSETAGAAEELRDALIVNPNKPSTLVEGLQQALAMPKNELRERLKNMQGQLSTNTVQEWAKTFVTTLQQPVPGTPVLRTKTLKGTDEAILLHDYRRAKSRLLLLDYDGSLVPFSSDYKDAKPPKAILELLEKLLADKRNDIVVVSGRSSHDLDTWLGHLPINLIGEHGACVRKAGHKRWHSLDAGVVRWKKAILPLASQYADMTPGARLEEKSHSIVWHYRSASAYYSQKHAVILKRTLKPLLKQHGLRLFQGNKILEIKDPRISKGEAIRSWLKTEHDFTLIVGDDFTDEDMFLAAHADDYTVKVGRGRTAARYRLPAPSDIKKLLNNFTKQ
jgi:trehalose 6-phosphate synthase/phosphatase